MLPLHDDTADEHDDLGVDAPDEEETPTEETDPAVTATPADLDPTLEKELREVMVEEEDPKVTAQKQLSARLIEAELTPEDLYDAGSI